MSRPSKKEDRGIPSLKFLEWWGRDCSWYPYGISTISLKFVWVLGFGVQSIYKGGLITESRERAFIRV